MKIDERRHRAEGIDVVMRFHDPTYMLQLERAVFSLVGQHYRPIRILLSLQRFSPEQHKLVIDTLGPMLSWADDVELVLLNFERDQPIDARSELVNLGFSAASGRYLALLDYDDVLFPEAYQMLITQLQTSGAGIAFARTPVVLTDVYPQFLHGLSQSHPFVGQDLTDLFRSNFCPIHSFVIDRRALPDGTLRFEPQLTIEEDYEFLIRVCSAVPSDFTLANVDIGLYFYKNDDSNTFTRGAELAPEVAARNSAAREFVELRRKMTVLTPAVQATLGIERPERGLTVRAWLERAMPDLTITVEP